MLQIGRCYQALMPMPREAVMTAVPARQGTATSADESQRLYCETVVRLIQHSVQYS